MIKVFTLINSKNDIALILENLLRKSALSICAHHALFMATLDSGSEFAGAYYSGND